MKNYLISIICLTSIICLLVEILPNGKMKKASCICLSFLLTLTMLMPIKNFSKNFVIKDEFNEYDYISEQAYAETLYAQYIKNLLSKESLQVSNIKVEFDNIQLNSIKKISIKLDKNNIFSEQEYVSIKENVCKTLSVIFNLDKSNVNFYE